MTGEQFDRYQADAVAGYARSIAGSGSLPWPEAREKARADHQRLLPAGSRTPGHQLWTVHDGDVEVGILWLYTEQKSDGRHAFIYDVEVHGSLRGRGYGRRIMQTVDEWCRAAGVVAVGLNVFGDNTAARALYEKTGYQVTSVQMRKFL